MWDIEGVGLYQTEWKEKVIPDVQDGVLKKSGSVVQIRDEWREIVGETTFVTERDLATLALAS